MKKTALTLSILCATMAANAKVKLYPLFTDNMVLQQQTLAPLWGEAKAGKKLTVTTSWNNRKYTTEVGVDGKWRVDVHTPTAGGPYTITLTDGKPVTLSNVMIGEVWLCTGQSNMQFPMEGWNIKTYADEIAASGQYENIRLMHIDNAISTVPADGLPKQTHTWEMCSPQTVKQFSATGYFFGKHLNQQRNVPVGLIMTCWGGTDIETWMSGETLKTLPDYAPTVNEIANDTLSAAEHEAKYQRELRQWMNTVGQKEGSMQADGTALWAQSQYDVAQWQTLAEPRKIDEVGYGNFDGFVWYRKTIDIPAAWAGKELRLQLAMIDDMDVTYFNGVEVGHTEQCPVNRDYTIPASLVKAGKAVITVKVLDTGGAGGLRGNATNMSIACGDDVMTLGGEWKMQLATSLTNAGKVPYNPVDNPYIPTVLYNAMIRPLAPYAVKGAIWYQGENNAPRAFRYRQLLPMMIADWRSLWKQNFPFVIAQLANYMERKSEPTESEWAELREAQLNTLHVDGTAMAVLIDAGMAEDIHPIDKATAGNRLGLAARHLAYGEDIAYSGPIYQNYTIEKGQIRISFTHADGGLKTKDGGALRGFAIAGADRQFHWADARIEGSSVVVSSPAVPMPIAVRYAWADNPDCNLYNGALLPASPFRTDQWPGLTINR